MRTLLIILLLSSFLGITSSGMLVMQHDDQHGHANCMAATVKGQPCPETGAALQFAVFHLEALKSFLLVPSSNMLMGSGLWLWWLLAWLLLAGSGVLIPIQSPPLGGAVSGGGRLLVEPHTFPFQDDFTRWLARHENSPNDNARDADVEPYD